MRNHKLNEAILHCLEHVAGSTSPPCIGAADFLIRLLDTDVFTCEEMDEITCRVGVIIRGITERHDLSQPRITTPDDVESRIAWLASVSVAPAAPH